MPLEHCMFGFHFFRGLQCFGEETCSVDDVYTDIPDDVVCLEEEKMEEECDEGAVYSSSSSESEYDSDGFSLNPNRNDFSEGILPTEFLDPTCEKLHNLLSQGELKKDDMFFKLIENSTNYISWLRDRQADHSLQFQWDNDILLFSETLEYHGHEKIYNLLRGAAHAGSGKGGIKTFNSANWNIPLPSRNARHKKRGYSTENGLHTNKVTSFLMIADNDPVKPLYENESVKIIPIILSKDAMAIKPGFTYDRRQGKLVGSTINLDFNYVSNNRTPDLEALRASAVQEAEAVSMTSADFRYSLPIGANYLTKGITSDETLNQLQQLAMSSQVCLEHLSNDSSLDMHGILVSGTKCIEESTCTVCFEMGVVCDECKLKGHTSTKPALRACNMCLKNKCKCLRVMPLGWAMDSESRNTAAQDKFEEEKKNATVSPALKVTQPFPDGIHVGKRKRQSFVCWFLVVDGERVNLVLLRELRNSLKEELRPHLRLNSVRNRDRQDVNSLIEIGSPAVINVIEKVATITHTIYPEKFRVSHDGQKPKFKQPKCMCLGELGHLFVADSTGTIYTVRANHYPADVSSLKDKVQSPLGMCYTGGILYISECYINQVRCIDIKGEVIVEPNKLTVAKLKAALKRFGLWVQRFNSAKRDELKRVLCEYLNKAGKTDSHCVQFDTPVRKPSALYVSKDTMFLASLEGKVSMFSLHCDGVKMMAKFIQSIECQTPLIFDMIMLNEKLYITATGEQGGIFVWQEGTEFTRLHHDPSAHGLAVFEKKIMYTNSSECQVKLLQENGNVDHFVGAKGESDGHAGEFIQPTIICVEGRSVFILDTACGKIKLVVSPSGLVKYLKELHEFATIFGLHEKGKRPRNITIIEAIEKLKQVLEFDERCIGKVKADFNVSGTEGPHGTVSSITVHDEKLIIQGLERIKQLIEELNPEYLNEFSLRAITTLCNENLFGDIRTHGNDMPLKLMFAALFNRAVIERLKRQCQCPFSYYTGPYEYYQNIFHNIQYKDLPSMPLPPKTTLTDAQVEIMRAFESEYGRSVPQKTVRNMSTKDNPGTLPIALYEENDKGNCEIVDFSTIAQLSDSTSSDSHESIIFKPGDYVAWKDKDELNICKLIERITSKSKSVDATIFQQHPFIQTEFHEDRVCKVPTASLCQVSQVSCDDGILEIDEVVYQDIISLLDPRTDQPDITEITPSDLQQATEEEVPVDTPTPLRRSARAAKRRYDDDFLYFDD